MRFGASGAGIERRRARHARGFTFVETLIVCAVMLLLATLAIPSFAIWQQRQRVEASMRMLLASMSYARSEAVRIGLPVVICRTDGDGRCVHNGGYDFGRDRVPVDWATGWVVALETGYGQRVLRTHVPAPGVRIRGAAHAIRFRPPAGQVIGGFRSFEIAPTGARHGASAQAARRCVSIAAGGRARVSAECGRHA